jgi:hypothetical protein
MPRPHVARTVPWPYLRSPSQRFVGLCHLGARQISYAADDVPRPFEELYLCHSRWPEPLCRMPDYAECIWAPELGSSLLAIRTRVPLILVRHSPFI